MKIGTQHRNKIWRSLVEFRNSNTFSTAHTEELARSTSNASTVSVESPAAQGFDSPGYFEVTKYTFKHTISLDQQLKKEDHDYCWTTTASLCYTTYSNHASLTDFIGCLINQW